MLSRTTTVAPKSAIGRFFTTVPSSRIMRNGIGDEVGGLVDLAEDLLDAAELPPPEPHDDVVLRPHPAARLAHGLGQDIGLGVLGVVERGRLDGFCGRVGIRSTVIGARPTWLMPRLEPGGDRRAAAAADRPAPATTPAPAPRAWPARASRPSTRSPRPGGSPCTGRTSCSGPFLPAIRGSTSNRAPQLWQKNTMPIERSPSGSTGQGRPRHAAAKHRSGSCERRCDRPDDHTVEGPRRPERGCGLLPPRLLNPGYRTRWRDKQYHMQSSRPKQVACIPDSGRGLAAIRTGIRYDDIDSTPDPLTTQEPSRWT